MHSFRARITILMILAILVYGLLVGGILLLSVRSLGGRSSEQTMDLICETNYRQMDEYLNGVEYSVNEMGRFIIDTVDVTEMARAGVIGADGSGYSLGDRDMDSAGQQRLDRALSHELKDVETIAHDIAIYTNGVSSYYFKLNPELSVKNDGFWYEKINSYTFQEREMIDITAYSSDDIQHVGWYYLPQDRGRPSWVGPYRSSNLDEMVISYIEPLYKSGTFIGVVGMDISYPILESHINELSVFDTGYAFLTDENGVVIYHPEIPVGALISNINAELEVTRGPDERVRTVKYETGGVKREATWRTLSNGIRLFVTAPVSEINGDWRRLSWMIVLLTPIVLIIFALGIRHIMQRMTRPLEELAEAAKEVSEGRYDLKLNYEGDDEIGVLTESFINMAGQVKDFVQDLNSKAYKDSLTGIRNKSAYDVYARQINDSISGGEGEGADGFAVAMFDCNDLKAVNDSYGHEKGDIYLKTASTLICRVFAHSPVFRIGGDEFVAVLLREDLEYSDELVKKFTEQAALISASAAHDWERADIAIGVSHFDPAIDTCIEDVSRRADVLMYEHKKNMKRHS